MPHLRVTEVGEFIHHRSCERRFKLASNNREEAKRLPFAERLFNVLDPVLQEEGRRREEEWEDSLQEAGFTDLLPLAARDPQRPVTWADFLAGAAALPPGSNAYAREVAIEAEVGAFQMEGRMDFCVLRWDGNRPHLRIVECKASRRDRTYQRVQVALYLLLARSVLQALPRVQLGGALLDAEDLDCVVARIDEATNEAQPILALPSLDVTQEQADLLRLLDDEGALRRIVNTPLADLEYQLNAKCDACVFNVHCLPESARLRLPHLIGVEPAVVRVLATAGVRTIDELAELDLNGPTAQRVRAQPGLTRSLASLRSLAAARRSTLPRGDQDPDEFEVQPLPNAPESQLPEHSVAGHRLVRVYLTVHYDYVENRIGALAAHVTTSDQYLHTPYEERGGRWMPGSRIVEVAANWRPADGEPVTRDVNGKDLDNRFQASAWTGRYDQDTGFEGAILQGFFHDLVEAIAEIAEGERAPVHFYVWNRSEMQQLVEACSRVGSGLLNHLRELLGCREPIDQLIYSCLEDEVHNRFALGWTGRGLAVASSLKWFGRRYFWRRRVGGADVDLDRVFTQDIFDFKTHLWLRANGDWAEEREEGQPGAARHTFEIRSRFHDSLSAPYWRALWGTLPDPAALGPGGHRIANSIRRYNEAREPGRFRAYLRARTHALRWVEERVAFKNGEIEKPLLRIADLLQFELGVNRTAEAAIDFLRLEHHVRRTDWLASRLVPPAYRVSAGRTIPVSQVVSEGRAGLVGRIDLTGYDLSADALQGHCSIREGDFVRLTPCAEDPTRGQTLRQLLRNGTTCVITTLDWDAGVVRLSPIPHAEGEYKLLSVPRDEGPVFDHAVLDENESATDFIAGRVEDRLRSRATHPACTWLDPIRPRVPEQEPLVPARAATCHAVAADVVLPNNERLAEDQREAAVRGLETRIQLLQGPPGTGKTTTTAVAALLRILARRQIGDVVLIAANTHGAVDDLVARIAATLPGFRAAADAAGIPCPSIRLLRVEGNDPVPGVEAVEVRRLTSTLRDRRREGVVVMGGTTNALLKAAEKLDGAAAYRQPGGFQASALLVDEASMMVFPYFLALATLVGAWGEVMLTGDHRQLAPIVAHDWEREDRPPVVRYQPYSSAYDAVRNLAVDLEPRQVDVTALRYTYRLPAVVRDLIARLYLLDGVQLAGAPQALLPEAPIEGSAWERIWRDGHGLYLAVHNERQSTNSNLVEAAVIGQILDNAPPLPADSTAIVTPHRAQRNLLQQYLAAHTADEGPVGVIDTVERLQGGERRNIIVSACQSDPASIAARVDFILDLNRSNVAFSRAQERLIVVCSETLLDHIPPEVDQYSATMLWKSLRALCTERVGIEELGGHRVTILTVPRDRLLADAEAGAAGH
jgi:hypothetical protein